MKILLVNKFHYQRDGGTKAYFDTARALEERGHTIAFFSMEHPNNLATPWSRFFVARSEYDDSQYHYSFLGKMKLAFKMIWNFEAQRKLEALLQEFRPDVAHLHLIYHQLSPSILWTLKKHHIPIVMTLHDYKIASPNYSLYVRGKIWEHGSGLRCLIDRCVKDSWVKSLVCATEQWFHHLIGSYELVDQLIAPSRFLIETVKKLGMKQNVLYVPQPLSDPVSASSEEPGAYLLFVGRLSPEKGVDVSLRAMKELPHEKLIILGEGPDRARLERLKQTLNLSNVEFKGAVFGEERNKYLAGAKAVLVPSVWYENMPYVVLEALGAGKPVIASRLGGMIERVQDGENGYLFKPGDAADLVTKVELLAKQDLRALSLSARKSVSDLTINHYGETLEHLYTRLIQAKK